MGVDKECCPFLKWAGGKSQLLARLRERMPEQFGTYYEPFVGAGALFLNVLPAKGVINDVNIQLINIYRQLKEDAQAVINWVNELDSTECDKDRYLQIRSLYNQKIAAGELDSECAALMIWCNKHCFNGLYRVNSKGFFNVPYNNRASGRSIDEDNLSGIGQYLQTASIEICQGDFEVACDSVCAGDFVYFDSPYIPVSSTADFTAYTKDGFTLADHKRLANLFRRLDKQGGQLMLSNNNVPLVAELYAGYRIEVVDVRRAINSKASLRTGREVIIRNY